jgi:hypothetical protein
MRPLSIFLILVTFPCAIAAPAWAVPPTVTPSPGYDARLVEQRRALQSQQPPIIAKSLKRWPAVRHRHKR